jgi:hypothetical protein
MILGVMASIVGIAGILSEVLAGSLGLMVAGQAVGGIGFGAAFAAALRLVMPLAAPHERGGLLAALYILAYAAFSIPVILAGLLVPTFGLVPTVAAYGTATFLLGVISLIRQLGIRAADRRSIPQR